MKRILLLIITILSMFLVSCQVDFSLIDTSMFEKEPEIYNVYFDSDGGSEVEFQQVKEESTVKRPENPTKESYAFDGWYTEEGDKWLFFTGIVEQEMTLYAKWIPLREVRFVTDYGEAPETQYIGDGRYATEPKIEYSGYYIDYWYDDYDNIWDFNELPIRNDITLHARWEKLLEIKAEDETIYLKMGSEIGELPELKKSGAYFLGWYRRNDKMALERVDKTTIFTESTYLVPKWEENENVILITLNQGEGHLPDNKKLLTSEKGAKLTDLPEPYSQGNSYFLGWYDENGVRYSKNSVAYSDLTLTAKYQFHTQCKVNEDGRHRFTPWQADPEFPSCTEDAAIVRHCLDCNEEETEITYDALGHKYNNDWTYTVMEKSRVCYVCDYKQVVGFDDITDCIVGTEIVGDVYGIGNADCLYNKNWSDDSKDVFCGKGGGEIIIKIGLKSNTSPHGIYVKGAGSSSFEVYVKYQGESEYKIITVTSFGDKPSLTFLDGRPISEIMLRMPNGGDGTELWQEIAIVKIPKVF